MGKLKNEKDEVAREVVKGGALDLEAVQYGF